jgi:cold shock CspA family protein
MVVRHAFEAARRQLQKHVQRRRREVKVHQEPRAPGVIVELVHEEGYGFIETADGQEVYFHRNSVLNDEFRHLKVGTGVRYVEERGEKGPQASTVEIVRKTEPRASESGRLEAESAVS